MQEFNSRDEFIQYSRESEWQWCYPDERESGNKVMTIAVFPWRCCGCGFETRNAGLMYDHASQCITTEHRVEQLELSLTV